jgi:hypothetical protein
VENEFAYEESNIVGIMKIAQKKRIRKNNTFSRDFKKNKMESIYSLEAWKIRLMR